MDAVCYYHRADLDGKCSAAIVGLRLPDCTFVGVDHHDDLEAIVGRHPRGVAAFVVDFSFPEPLFAVLRDRTDPGMLPVWIDHHGSSIQAAKGTWVTDLPGLRAIGEAGRRPFVKAPRAANIRYRSASAIRFVGRLISPGPPLMAPPEKQQSRITTS